MKNKLENLELKLLQTRKENAEKLDEIESEFNDKYSELFGVVFKNDNLGFKRYISVNFQLEKLDNPEKYDFEILKNSISKALEILPLNQEKKENLKDRLILLAKSSGKVEMLTEGFNPLKKLDNKEDNLSTKGFNPLKSHLLIPHLKRENNKGLDNFNSLNEIFRKNNDLRKNINFPILQDLKKHGILDDNDILNISLKFKEKHNFLESIIVLSLEKREIIKHNYYELHNTDINNKIRYFKNDFKAEIDNSNLLIKYPKVFKFIGKNYFRLRLKNKVESKKEKLRRLYKIAFLKLYRLKYSGIDINSILNQIDNLSDFEDFINLIVKHFETLRQNPNLQKDYIVSREIDDITDSLDEAENNKQKILFSEKSTIKVVEIFENHDKKINENDLEDLLSDDVDLIGEDFIKRDNINVGVFSELIDVSEDEITLDNENKDTIDIDEFYEKLQLEYNELEKKKQKLFLSGEYDLLDEINDELLLILKKLKKLELLGGITENN